MSAPIGVLGAGSWGTALAVYLGRMGSVRLWARHAELAARIREERRNPDYLPGAELPDSVEVTADLGDLDACEVVLMVVPSHGARELLRRFLAARPSDAPLVLVSATKGIEAETAARMSQVAFEEALAADRELRYAVLSGPNFAAEVAAGAPSAAVVAAGEAELAGRLRELFSGPTFRFYSSSDVVGVELGGAAKNVVAVAAGLVTGLGLGHNTLAALITRGLHEMTRLGVACGGQPRTFSGLAGLGDLVLTCTGGLSRNRRTGLELAAGKTLDQIRAETPMVAEGIRNAVSVTELAARRGIEMPITEEVRRVLYEGKDPRRALGELMTRDLKTESEL
ncbi:MAG: NAD(P)H-dependent glycerol-3-phosphate dehydrogenase [Thermoanaerobaculia bacterium]|nr:NAD(P)H-dependent glycerol-3-phosphate dehydrogenase [Thermoanaerobaculia bacterium]